MAPSTVFSEMVMGFAETVTRAVESGEKEKEWSVEDVQQTAVACREIGEKFASIRETLRKALACGLNVAEFVRQEEPRLARLNEWLLRLSAILAEGDRLQTMSPAMRDVLTEFEAMGKIASQYRDLLKEALSKMTAPRRPIDWGRVEEARAAGRRGETKPFQRTPKPTGS